MPPQGSRRRRQEDGDGDGGADGVDRLSDLPEELRLQIIGRLDSAHEAARTSVLSRRWRGLWTGLLELTFRGVGIGTGSVEAALAQLTDHKLDLLDVRIEEPVTPGRVSSLLRAAARLGPKVLSIGDDYDPEKLSRPVMSGTFYLPCLERTTSLKISILEMSLAPPPAGEFAALTSLSIKDCSSVDIGALLPLCPCLRFLVLHKCLEYGPAIVHSPLLEELVLRGNVLNCVDIEAPMLKKVDVELYVMDELSVSFFAPMVKQFEWCIVYESVDVVFCQLWRLNSVCELRVEGRPPCVQIQLDTHPSTFQGWDFAEAIAQLRFPNFSVLELDILTDGHVFGPMVLHLLRIWPVIQTLRISMEGNDRNMVNIACPKDCPCKQPNGWRSESVALTNLEAVEIVGLEGKDHEVDFLKLVLQCAPVLKRMTVRLVDGASRRKILRIYKKYPNVECAVYRRLERRRAKSSTSSPGLKAKRSHSCRSL
ncbi:unnamed protein product [Urochloa decumbens]|uniref:F-box domain-containing protein n=1 Tax=Urochloa decumbens TaxID=240449 RepID=A0ABC9FW91_9POAL